MRHYDIQCNDTGMPVRMIWRGDYPDHARRETIAQRHARTQRERYEYAMNMRRLREHLRRQADAS